jgi:hypothetical protein
MIRGIAPMTPDKLVNISTTIAIILAFFIAAPLCGD